MYAVRSVMVVETTEHQVLVQHTHTHTTHTHTHTHIHTYTNTHTQSMDVVGSVMVIATAERHLLGTISQMSHFTEYNGYRADVLRVCTSLRPAKSITTLPPEIFAAQVPVAKRCDFP